MLHLFKKRALIQELCKQLLQQKNYCTTSKPLTFFYQKQKKEQSKIITHVGTSIIGCCVLERLPIIQPKTPAWEVNQYHWQNEYLNEFQKEYLAEYTKSGQKQQEEGIGDKSDIWEPSPVETEFDEQNDHTSLKRHLTLKKRKK
eukprot:TRINITY_DN106225_c0_g1_i1.p1 TRINITY_DN106225_c0_g1~~TRINITY_DN106225_c0_g1_i1.p1  ORF type:complete len:144 (-),score=7.43 TRINITY_DN106225_c0_g1_i1:70-501(-)